MNGTVAQFGRYILPVFWVLICAGCSADTSPLLQASGQQAWIPATDESFSSYVSHNEHQIRGALAALQYAGNPAPFGPDYPLAAAVAMRSPYEIPPSSACEQSASSSERKGFLLIHGLTDSPYLLRGVAASLAEQYPCAMIRGVLLPGHGTVPGDTLSMRHEDWIRVTEFGVNSFRNEVDSLYMVGFSTGTSLSLLYADSHRDDSLLKGLILLSPAVAARSGSAFLAPYLRWFSKWLGKASERDAARYESFSVNAGAEFYLLTRPLNNNGFAALDIPVFMAGSGDDATVNMEAAREFFCTKTPPDRRHMIWYSAQATHSDPQQLCSGLEVVAAEAPDMRVYSLSHTGISVPPDDPHYGLDGRYSICLHYGEDSEDFRTCRNDNSQTIYAERNLGSDGRFQGKLIRRGSFNPHYAKMLEEIVCFIDENC